MKYHNTEDVGEAIFMIGFVIGMIIVGGLICFDKQVPTQRLECCYHGYTVLSDGTQLLDAQGRGIPCTSSYD
jgi:hypothetical protein